MHVVSMLDAATVVDVFLLLPLLYPSTSFFIMTLWCTFVFFFTMLNPRRAVLRIKCNVYIMISLLYHSIPCAVFFSFLPHTHIHAHTFKGNFLICFQLTFYDCFRDTIKNYLNFLLNINWYEKKKIRIACGLCVVINKWCLCVCTVFDFLSHTAFIFFLF